MSDDKTNPEYYLNGYTIENVFFGTHLDHKKVSEVLALLMKERQDRNKDLFQKLDEDNE